VGVGGLEAADGLGGAVFDDREVILGKTGRDNAHLAVNHDDIENHEPAGEFEGCDGRCRAGLLSKGKWWEREQENRGDEAWQHEVSGATGVAAIVVYGGWRAGGMAA
jgi:hypothetical protein